MVPLFCGCGKKTTKVITTKQAQGSQSGQGTGESSSG
jgi:hypothetical protein